MVLRTYKVWLFPLIAAALRAQTGGIPLPISKDVNPPHLVFQVDADFPRAERQGLRECHVVTGVVIDEKGIVYSAQVASSNDLRCNEPVVAAVLHYRYRPATRNGKAVAVKTSVATDAQLF